MTTSTQLPDAFVSRMTHQLRDEADAFFRALDTPSPVSLRLNHFKGRSSFALKKRVPWCNEGYYLESRPSFHMDPHWHGGAYYVQEASSMILDEVIRQLKLDDTPRTWMDLCAAPGGKTGILASHKKSHDILVANEVIAQRRSILYENLIKGGYTNTFLLGEKPSAFNSPFADIMLIDAPCAGEGMMRKDPEAVHQWSPKLVQDCAIMQQNIVHHAVAALRPGGYLIYSTCSYSPQENMENVAGFINKLPLKSIALNFPDDWGIVETNFEKAKGYQLFPHRVEGEGLFITVLQKEHDDEKHPGRKTKDQFTSLPAWLNEHIHHPEMWVVKKNDDDHAVISIDALEKANDLLNFFPQAQLLSVLGPRKGKDFIPSHFMAMSGIYAESTHRLDVRKEVALDYLERITQTIPEWNMNGWSLISFEDTILGWAKKTTQGWKNHYPLNWRLRSRNPL